MRGVRPPGLALGCTMRQGRALGCTMRPGRAAGRAVVLAAGRARSGPEQEPGMLEHLHLGSKLDGLGLARSRSQAC
jgi:hypothetical protein